MIETAPPVQAPAWVRHAVVVALNVDDQPYAVQLDAPLGNRSHASPPPADPDGAGGAEPQMGGRVLDVGRNLD